MSYSRLLSTRFAAEIAGVSAATLKKLRVTGDGPLYVVFGATVRYREFDLLAWIDSLPRRRSTPEGAARPAGPGRGHTKHLAPGTRE